MRKRQNNSENCFQRDCRATWWCMSTIKTVIYKGAYQRQEGGNPRVKVCKSGEQMMQDNQEISTLRLDPYHSNQIWTIRRQWASCIMVRPFKNNKKVSSCKLNKVTAIYRITRRRKFQWLQKIKHLVNLKKIIKREELLKTRGYESLQLVHLRRDITLAQL